MSYEDFIGKWRQLLYIILGAFIALFLITTTFLFYHRRKQIKDAENRSMRLSITLAISNVIFCPLLVIYNGFHENTFPCFVILWNIYLSVVIYLTVILVRGLRLIFLAQLNYAMLDVSLRTRTRTRITLSNGSLGDSNSNKELTITEYSKWYRKRTINSVMCFGLTAIIGFFVIILIGIMFSFDKFSISNVETTECVAFNEFIPLYIFISLFILSAPVLYFFLRSKEDGFGLRRDIFKNIFLFTSCFICHILFLTEFKRANQIWGNLMWLSTSLIIGHVTMILIPIIRSHKKKRDPGNGCEEARFSKILHDDVLFEKYKICAASFFCTELMLFVEEYQYLKSIVVKYYKAHPYGSDPAPSLDDDIVIPLHDATTTSKDSIKITPPTVSIHDTLVKFLDFPSSPADDEVPERLRPYFLRFFRTFLEPSADLAINVIGSTMQDVATKISTDDYRINMFETARNEVLHLLYGNTFHSFVDKYKDVIQSRLKKPAETEKS